jgi:hypothetical protein
MIHGGVDPAAVDLQPGQTQAHLDAGQRAHEGKVVEVAEMADAEDAALELP